MPFVSIIVPVYGVERYIERCAVSLFEQTYKDIEYIFVNDATPDKSIEVLRTVMVRYPERAKAVRIVEHPKNKGLSAARNTGLDHATGDYIWHVDSDDYVATNAVEKWVEVAEKQSADIVICDINILTTKGIETERGTYKDKEDYIRRLLQHTQKCAHWNKFYSKSFIDEIGIRSDEQIRMAEDYAVTPRLLYCAKRVAILHEPLYFYETTNQSSYVHNLRRVSIESHRRAEGILTEFFADKPEYANIAAILSQRSITSLVKNSNKEGWQMIADVYSDSMMRSGKGMTLVNRIIYALFKNHHWCLLQAFMKLYHCVMQDRS